MKTWIIAGIMALMFMPMGAYGQEMYTGEGSWGENAPYNCNPTVMGGPWAFNHQIGNILGHYVMDFTGAEASGNGHVNAPDTQNGIPTDIYSTTNISKEIEERTKAIIGMPLNEIERDNLERRRAFYPIDNQYCKDVGPWLKQNGHKFKNVQEASFAYWKILYEEKRVELDAYFLSFLKKYKDHYVPIREPKVILDLMKENKVPQWYKDIPRDVKVYALRGGYGNYDYVEVKGERKIELVPYKIKRKLYERDLKSDSKKNIEDQRMSDNYVSTPEFKQEVKEYREKYLFMTSWEEIKNDWFGISPN